MGGITLPGGGYVMQEKDHLGRLPVIQHIIPRSRNVEDEYNSETEEVRSYIHPFATANGNYSIPLR